MIYLLIFKNKIISWILFDWKCHVFIMIRELEKFDTALGQIFYAN